MTVAAPTVATPVLRVSNLEVVYSDVILVLRGVSLSVPTGSIVTILGANGAGKTTLLRAVGGLLAVHRGEITKGTVEVNGRPTTHLGAPVIVRLGVSQVMEGRRIFKELTVEDNLRAGGYTRRSKTELAESYQRVMDLFPVVAQRRRSVAGYLSGGEQQMLAIGRALMASPKLLLLDEPSLGLAPLLVEQIRRIIVDINQQGTSVLLVEQNATMALSIAHHGYVMENGKIVKDGRGEDLLADKDIQEFYLGVGETGRASFRDVKSYRRRKQWSASRAEPLLVVREVTLRFGGVNALNGVDFDVWPGELLAIIGPNGAGKTSIFNCLNGVYRPQAGSMQLEGRELVGLRPRQMAGFGVARTFQNLGLFVNLNVIDNLMLGRHHLMSTGFLTGALWVGKAKREEIRHRRRCEEIIDLLELGPFRYHAVGALPYGIQKRIELGRALAMDPRLLLLDEPVAGMNLEETADMARYILEIKDQLGLAMILVEHDMHMVMDLADRVMALNFGEPIATGTPAEIQSDQRVIEAYLGQAS